MMRDEIEDVVRATWRAMVGEFATGILRIAVATYALAQHIGWLDAVAAACVFSLLTRAIASRK